MTLCAAAAVALLATATASAAEPAVPQVPDNVKAAAAAINADAKMQALLKELTSPEAQKERFNNLVEITRIASPSRFEMRRADAP